jgi:hypothetical protein
MSNPLTYLARDTHSEYGRVICLLVDKSNGEGYSLALFDNKFGKGPKPEILDRVEFFDRYCNFVPETVREMVNNCPASGFFWSSHLFFNYD